MSNNPDPVDTPRLEADPSANQKEALRLAAGAAKNGKPVEMIEELFKSYVLDGLIRGLLYRWSSFTYQDAEDIMAQSVNVLYDTVQKGKPVGAITPFLKKVSFRKAFDLHAKRARTQSLPPGSPELETPYHDPVPKDPGLSLDGTEEPKHEEKVRQSIKKARELLPRLGQENVRLVMSFIFDAVEAGQQNITNEEIEKALGLSSDTVRASKSRGFCRLKRIAQAESLLPKNFDYDTIVPPDQLGDQEDETTA